MRDKAIRSQESGSHIPINITPEVIDPKQINKQCLFRLLSITLMRALSAVTTCSYTLLFCDFTHNNELIILYILNILLIHLLVKKIKVILISRTCKVKTCGIAAFV